MSDMSLRHITERRQREVLTKLFEATNLDGFEQFRNFPVYVPRFNIARFLAHYEVFKRIVDLPGVIVDLGVFRGASTFTWAKLCEIFCPTDVRKVVYGFDTFEGFPGLSPEDGSEDAVNDRRKGGYSGGDTIEQELLLAREAMNQDRHIAHVERVQFVKGDACETIPQFVEEQGNGLQLALLNLDLDLYAPTKLALEYFVPRMVRGGIIIADEYAVTAFGGETKAINDYFLEHTGRKPKIWKLPWHSNPSAFIEIE